MIFCGIINRFKIQDLKMTQPKEIIFRVTGKKSEGKDVSPAFFDIKLAKKLIEQADRFVEAGIDKKKREPIGILVEEGSWKLKILVPVILAVSVQTDIKAINKGVFSEVQPDRLQVVYELQKNFKNTDLNIDIGAADEVDILKINKATTFELHDIWIETEEILYGVLENLGGAKNPNFHLRTGDGISKIISAKKTEIMKLQKEVPLYNQEIGVEVIVKENINTGEIKDFIYQNHHIYSNEINDSALEKTIELGTKSWQGIHDSVSWVKLHRS